MKSTSYSHERYEDTYHPLNPQKFRIYKKHEKLVYKKSQK